MIQQPTFIRRTMLKVNWRRETRETTRSGGIPCPNARERSAMDATCLAAPVASAVVAYEEDMVHADNVSKSVTRGTAADLSRTVVPNPVAAIVTVGGRTIT